MHSVVLIIFQSDVYLWIQPKNKALYIPRQFLTYHDISIHMSSYIIIYLYISTVYTHLYYINFTTPSRDDLRRQTSRAEAHECDAGFEASEAGQLRGHTDDYMTI